MQKITPNLWFNGNAAQGAQFYADAFPDSRVLATTHYPTEGLPDFQRDMAGEVLTVDVDLAGLRITCINAGPEFPITPAISLLVNFDPARHDDARGSLEEVWSVLSQDAQILMPLDAYPFSPLYGWLQDRYGMSWQLMLTDPAGELRPFIVPNLLFGGQAQNRAEEARAFYTSLFPDARNGVLIPYTEQSGPAHPGAVMFCDFALADQWFAAMDSATEQDFSFTEGVSFVVECADQAEIDHFWAALSTVPEAEQCGWCKDRFGVSWQIVPDNMGDLMQRPQAYQNLMEMKKIEIAKF